MNAFHGRVSTEDNQDPESSRSWQLSRASTLIQSDLDIDRSRSLPWQRRVQASQLLTALRIPQRGSTAIVVGEPHAVDGKRLRALTPDRLRLRIPRFSPPGSTGLLKTAAARCRRGPSRDPG
ncbi:hypothetical protein Misp04_43880 [Micromonospora sp. NBRC 101691]|nr:hypothetical protein Misp04_43880 [Micromonospora sp. NBRC 101691]